jgi:hypothetical protein
MVKNHENPIRLRLKPARNLIAAQGPKAPFGGTGVPDFLIMPLDALRHGGDASAPRFSVDHQVVTWNRDFLRTRCLPFCAPIHSVWAKHNGLLIQEFYLEESGNTPNGTVRCTKTQDFFTLVQFGRLPSLHHRESQLQIPLFQALCIPRSCCIWHIGCGTPFQSA